MIRLVLNFCLVGFILYSNTFTQVLLTSDEPELVYILSDEYVAQMLPEVLNSTVFEKICWAEDFRATQVTEIYKDSISYNVSVLLDLSSSLDILDKEVDVKKSVTLSDTYSSLDRLSDEEIAIKRFGVLR